MFLDIFQEVDWFLVILWAAVFIVTLIVEIETFNLTTIWFCISAFVSLILAVLNVDPVIQVIVFIVLSILLLILTKPLVKKFMKNGVVRTNSDMIIGKIGYVTKDIIPNQYGEVKVQGNLWRAVNYNDITFREGEKVLIDEISGVKVIVSKFDEHSSNNK